MPNTLLETARKYLYVREIPPNSNRAPEIDGWHKAVNCALGSPWCASFVSGVGVEALGVDRWPFLRSASVQAIVTWCEARKRTAAIALAKPGDLVAFYFPSHQRYAHIGIVSKRTKNFLTSLEGNTIPDHAQGDTRDGYGVFEKVRTPSDRMLALTWP